MALLALLLTMEVARADSLRLVVIVSSSQSLTDISSADVRAIYLGRLTHWPTHRPILPVMLSSNTPAGRMFIHRVIGMAEVDYAHHWIGMIFRGQVAAAPLDARSAEEATGFVAAHGDAIAIVDVVPAEKNVRVLTVDGKPPRAVDYPFR